MRVNFTLKVKKAANNNTRLAKSEDNTRRPSGRRSGFVVFFGGGGIMNAKYLGTPIPIGRHAQDIALDWLPSLTNRGVSSFGERRRMRNSRNWFHFLYFFFHFAFHSANQRKRTERGSRLATAPTWVDQSETWFCLRFVSLSEGVVNLKNSRIRRNQTAVVLPLTNQRLRSEFLRKHVVDNSEMN